jgi:hypothetical protein
MRNLFRLVVAALAIVGLGALVGGAMVVAEGFSARARPSAL